MRRINKLKRGILLASVFIASAITALSVYAEYFVYPGSCMEPVCAVHHYHRLHHHLFSYHHRYHHYVRHHCPCSEMIWAEDNCGACGYWVVGYPSYIQTIRYGYVVEPPGYHYYYGDEDYINYDPDLATGDDNQSIPRYGY